MFRYVQVFLHPLKIPQNTNGQNSLNLGVGIKQQNHGFVSLKFPLKTPCRWGSWKPFLLNSLGRWCHFRAYSFRSFSRGVSNFQTSNKKGVFKNHPYNQRMIFDHTSLHDFNQSRVVLFTDQMDATSHLEAHDDADRKSPRIAGTWPPAYPNTSLPANSHHQAPGWLHVLVGDSYKVGLVKSL